MTKADRTMRLIVRRNRPDIQLLTPQIGAVKRHLLRRPCE